METWLFVLVGAYLLWWLMTRIRLYRWLLVLAVLVAVFGSDHDQWLDLAPILVAYFVLSVVLFHGRRAIVRMLPWT